MRTVIVANGTIDHPAQARALISSGDLLIAVDGGALHCLALGVKPDVVIGDLDSLPDAHQSDLETSGVDFIVHPRDKDLTDLELALDYAISKGAREILLLGLLGGRLDQTLGNLLLLSRQEWNRARLVVAHGYDRAYLVRSGEFISIKGQIGDLVSLIPLSPIISGVSIKGLKWPLSSAQIHFGSTLSISNEMVAPTARIEVGNGQLLVVHRQNSLDSK